MVAVIKWLLSLNYAARLTQDGQRFNEAGFEIVSTGGTCTAWAKQLGESYILVTDSDGLDHKPSEDEVMWLVGIFGNDKLDELELIEAESVEEAIERADQLRNKYTQG